MELKDTVGMMLSDDYKERFKAEYYQTKIRYDKLDIMVVDMEIGKLNFEPACCIEVFINQLEYMGRYLDMLKIRAQIEGIEL